MEQDDKASAAVLSLGSVSGPSQGATARNEATQPGVVDAPSGGGKSPGHLEGGASREPEAIREHQTGGETLSPTKDKPASTKGTKRANNVRRIRIERMVSKAELARRANLSVLTIDRVERGYGCRMDTKRKILEALGLSLADRVRVFGEEE